LANEAIYDKIQGDPLSLINAYNIVSKEEKTKTKSSSDDDWKRLEKWKFGRANYP